MIGKRRAIERRSITRYEAVGAAILEWQDGHESWSIPVSFLDISQNGARVAASRAPRRGTAVWLIVNDGRSETRLHATVVGVRRRWLRLPIVRLRFEGLCPYDVLRVAIRGMDFSHEEPVPDAEELRDRHLWR